MRGDRGDQAGAGLRRLEVGDAHPLDPLDRRQLGQQGLEQPQVAEVLAVGGGVLADQEQLPGTLVGQPARLGEHVGGAAGHEGATKGRDGAERAPTVAAGSELERSHRPGVEAAAVTVTRLVGGRVDPLRRRDGQQLAAVLRRVRVQGLAGEDRTQPVGDVGIVVEAQDGVRLRERGGQLRAVPLGQAPDGDDGLRRARLTVGPLEVGGGQQRVHGVLLGRLDETTGVHDHGLGVRRVLDQQEPAGLQPPGELLGVHLVARTAERHHGDRGRRGAGAGQGSDRCVHGPRRV